MFLKKSIMFTLFLSAPLSHVLAMDLPTLVEEYCAHPARQLGMAYVVKQAQNPTRTTLADGDIPLTQSQQKVHTELSRDLESRGVYHYSVISESNQYPLFTLNLTRWVKDAENQNGEMGDVVGIEDEDNAPKSVLWSISKTYEDYSAVEGDEVAITQGQLAQATYLKSLEFFIAQLRKVDWVYYTEDFPKSMHRFLDVMGVGKLVTNAKYTVTKNGEPRPVEHGGQLII